MTKSIFFLSLLTIINLLPITESVAKMQELEKKLQTQMDEYKNNRKLKRLIALEKASQMVSSELYADDCPYEDSELLSKLKLRCKQLFCYFGHQKIVVFKKKESVESIINQHKGLLESTELEHKEKARLKRHLYALMQVHIGPQINTLKKKPKHYLRDRSLLLHHLSLQNAEPKTEDLSGTSKEYRRKIKREKTRRKKQISILEKETYNPILAEIYPNLFG